MTATAGKQQEPHPGVIALREKLADARKSLAYWSRASESEREERELQSQIDALQERLRMLKRHRAESAAGIELRQAEVTKWEKIIALAEEDPRVAQAFWMKLLLEKQSQLKAQKKAREAERPKQG